MKFTAFVLATAAATASAQFFMPNGNAGFGGWGGNPGFFPSGVAYAPYQAQVQPAYPYPVQQPYPVAQPYPIIAPQQVDPLAWERDCTWINSVNFRAALSRATCGVDVCVSKSPNGNGGGNKRTKNSVPAKKACRNLRAPGGVAGDQAHFDSAECAQHPHAALTAVAGVFTDGNHVWGTVLNRAGRVCAVAYTGNDLSSQFPYGRIQSMKRANTANSLSLPGRAMPSHVTNNHELIAPGNNEAWNANIGLGQGNNYALGLLGQESIVDSVSTTRATNYYAEHNGGSPFHRQHYNDNGWNGFSHDRFNPGNVDVHYQGAASNYGEACGTNRQDPMCMQKPGGYDYSAGGLALYDAQGVLRGAIGVAGDNDCASHAIAWKAREQLAMDYTPANTDRAKNNDNVHMTKTEKTERLAPTVATNHLFSYNNCKLDTFGTAAQASNNNAVSSARQNGICSLHPSHEGAEAWNGNRIKQRLDIWAHAGVKAEDNVVFLPNEVRNFPLCYYDVVKNFRTSNPTENSMYSPAKA